MLDRRRRHPADRADRLDRPRRGQVGHSTGRAATDDGGIARYKFMLDDASFAPSAAQPDRRSRPARLHDTGPTAGTLPLHASLAEDVAGNLGPASNEANATLGGPPPGLVAAYGFDEGSGTTPHG